MAFVGRIRGGMKRFLSIVGAFFGLVLVALASWTIAYNYQERLSDRQLILIAATRAAKKHSQYASGEDLISSNPGCCIALHSNHEWLRFPSRLYEDGVSVVQMDYAIRENPKLLYFEEFAIGSNGTILDTRGMETTTPMAGR
jgi:hypothetical protein